MRVSDEAARKFTSLYTLLMYYAGQERGILMQGMDLEDFKECSLAWKIRCRDAIYEPSPLTRRFLDANRDLLTEEAQATLAQWARHHVYGTFAVLKRLRKHSVFMSSEGIPKVYAALGLNSGLGEMIPKAVLPVLVKTALLPCDGAIVCDGLLMAADHIVLGPNMRRTLNEDYNEAKEAGDIISSLD